MRKRSDAGLGKGAAAGEAPAEALPAGGDPERGAPDQGKLSRALSRKEEAMKTPWARARYYMSAAVDNTIFTYTMAVLTVWALFGSDIQMAGTQASADEGFLILTIICLIGFATELLLQSLSKDGYFLGFYFYLDVIATVSMLFDIPTVMEGLTTLMGGGGGGDVSDSTTMLKAARASRAGTRAGRIVRLVRLIRILKLYKQISQQQEEGEEEEEEEENPESKVGSKLSDLTTRKVIIGVLAMLFILPVFDIGGGYLGEASFAEPMGLQMLHYTYATSGSTPEFESEKGTYLQMTTGAKKGGKETQYVYELTMCEDVVFSDAVGFELRKGTEELTYRFKDKDTCDGKVSTVKINQRWSNQLQGILNMFQTIFICIILAGGAMMFSKDANDLVLRPIERMVKRFQDMAENPLAKRSKVKKGDAEEQQYETKILENAFEKVYSLMTLGFGDAGSEIIGSNMQNGGDLDPMIPGQKMVAIFGFCDIRQFTDTTEVLQEGIMEFVNNIAKIVHMEVSLHAGSANKNIGDAFLLVWKFRKDITIEDVANAGRCPPDKREAMSSVADQALASFVIIMTALKRSKRLKLYMEDERLTERIPNFAVRMGFGLHAGWAIEGAIGSEYKIDASYLSPNVNMASRLEAATKQFRTPILLSEHFVALLSPSTQARVREIDRVCVKGSNQPVSLFTYDCDMSRVAFPEEGSMKAEYRSFSDREFVQEFDENPDIVATKTSTPEFLARFGEGYQAYKDGDWGKAKSILSRIIEEKTDSTGAHCGDGPSLTLMGVMEEYNFQAPSSWKGYRDLTEK